MKTIDDPIAICGLDCSRCDIYRIPSDKEVAQRMLDWFKKKG